MLFCLLKYGIMIDRNGVVVLLCEGVVDVCVMVMGFRVVSVLWWGLDC